MGDGDIGLFSRPGDTAEPLTVLSFPLLGIYISVTDKVNPLGRESAAPVYLSRTFMLIGDRVIERSPVPLCMVARLGFVVGTCSPISQSRE